MDEVVNIRIRDLNPLIVCSLCAGYYIDATTITECLHTFCKSCVVKFLQSSKCCPHCSLKIHETQPMMNLKPDHVMQDIVYKLVPGLYENEEKRKEEFYRSRGIVKELKEEALNNATHVSTVYSDPHGHYYQHDPLLCFCLEKYSTETCGYQLPALSCKFIRCSARVCVFHIKSLLVEKLVIPSHLNVEILCDGQRLSDFMSLKEIRLTYWLLKPSPMMLYYEITQRKCDDIGELCSTSSLAGLDKPIATRLPSSAVTDVGS